MQKESDGYALIQVVVSPMQTPAPNSQLSMPLQTATVVRDASSALFFDQPRGQRVHDGSEQLLIKSNEEACQLYIVLYLNYDDYIMFIY